MSVVLLAAGALACGDSRSGSSAGSQGDSTSAPTSGNSADETEASEDDASFVPMSDLPAMPDLGPADSHAEDMQPIWNASCILYCHAVGIEPPAGELDLFENAYQNVVSQPSGQLPTMMLVSPGDLDESYLWHKLIGTHLNVGGEGDPMPAYAPPLDEATLGRIEAWILAGAPP